MIILGTQIAPQPRLHSLLTEFTPRRYLLHRHHPVPSMDDPFARAQRNWWARTNLSPTELLHLRYDLATLDQLAIQIDEVDGELRRLSHCTP